MAVAEQQGQNTTSHVARLDEPIKGRSLWADAWRRLIRNRAALLGMAIIVLNIAMAIFAGSIAPKDYKTQVLMDNNAAPRWVIDFFGVMTPKDEGGYVTVSDAYPLGADNLGRDILSRIIYGSRVSLSVAFIGPIVSLAIGLWCVWLGTDMSDAQGSTCIAESVRFVASAIVRHNPCDGDTEASVIGHGRFEVSNGASFFLIGMDLAECDA